MTTKTVGRFTSVRAHQRYKMKDGTIVRELPLLLEF